MSISLTNAIAKAVRDGADNYGRNNVYADISFETSSTVYHNTFPAYIPKSQTVSGKTDAITANVPFSTNGLVILYFPVFNVNNGIIYMILTGSDRNTMVNNTWRFRIIAFS